METTGLGVMQTPILDERPRSAPAPSQWTPST
jgi:hypothetical protein